jgi:hypothetical protein
VPHPSRVTGLAPRDPEKEAPPAFHFYARKLNVEADSNVVFFEAFTCWLRPLELKLEESTVSRLPGRSLMADVRTTRT